MSTLKHWRAEYIALIHEAEASNLLRPQPAAARP
jgi:NADH-quinone oxidoreductase subunit F